MEIPVFLTSVESTQLLKAYVNNIMRNFKCLISLVYFLCDKFRNFYFNIGESEEGLSKNIKKVVRQVGYVFFLDFLSTNFKN